MKTCRFKVAMQLHSIKISNFFFLLKKLSEDFNLRIIRIYGAAGHGKGAIDGMSSFGVKNILMKDIVIYGVFFNISEDIVDYLTIKCPQFNYTHLPSNDVVKSQISQNDAIIVKDCMKQHLIIFAPYEPVFCKEYLCSCNVCLRFDFNPNLGGLFRGSF